MSEQKESILDLLEAEKPLGIQSCVVLKRRDGSEGEVVPIGIDDGANAAKVAVQGPSGTFVTIRVPKAYLLAEQALAQAGYAPGEIHVALGYAVPTDEVQHSTDGAGDKLRVFPDTKAALEKYIDGAVWRVTRRSERGKLETWTLRVDSVFPQSQTLAAMIVFTRSPQGELTSPYDGMSLYDFGHHDTQKATIMW